MGVFLEWLYFFEKSSAGKLRIVLPELRTARKINFYFHRYNNIVGDKTLLSSEFNKSKLKRNYAKRKKILNNVFG